MFCFGVRCLFSIFKVYIMKEKTKNNLNHPITSKTSQITKVFLGTKAPWFLFEKGIQCNKRRPEILISLRCSQKKETKESWFLLVRLYMCLCILMYPVIVQKKYNTDKQRRRQKKAILLYGLHNGFQSKTRLNHHTQVVVMFMRSCGT